MKMEEERERSPSTQFKLSTTVWPDRPKVAGKKLHEAEKQGNHKSRGGLS